MGILFGYVILLTAGLTHSVDEPWQYSMKSCIDRKNVRLLIEDDIPIPWIQNKIQRDIWISDAKYDFDGEKIIMTVRKNSCNKSSETPCEMPCGCLICNKTFTITESLSSLRDAMVNMSIGNFYPISIKSDVIPLPNECKIYRHETNKTEFTNCTIPADHYCPEDTARSFILTIFRQSSNECESSCRRISPCEIEEKEKKFPNEQTSSNSTDCSLLSYLRCSKHLFIVVAGILVLVFLFNVLCITCCVRYKVKRKLLAIQKEKTNEHRSRPISEAITRIYKHMNNFEDQHNSGYDLVVNMSKKANFNALSEANACEDYDRGFFRLASHSGDYDKAWCTNWSSAPSPESDYAEVQKISKQLMVTVPEEEIYSKQRLDPESIAADVTRSCSEREEAPNKDPTGSSSHTWVVNEDEGNGGMNQPDEQTNQQANAEGTSETIKLEKRESENDKHDVQELKTQRERLINNTRAEIHLKKARDPIETVSGDRDTKSNESNEIREKNDKMESKKKDKKVRRSKLDMKSKSENTKTVATCTTEAEKMINEETAILIESMNNITSKTKL